MPRPDRDSEAEGEDRPAPEPRSSPRCPTCGSHENEVISLFGMQAMTLQYRCEACGAYFEAVKYDEP